MDNTWMWFGMLVLSLIGWGMYFHYKWKIHAVLIPIFLFASITCLVFGAGLLNMMPLVVYLIFSVGLILFIVFVIRFTKIKYQYKELLAPGVIFFILLSTVLVFWLKGLLLIHYDNFSHWGLIVKEMFRVDGLPDGTTTITFRNYPPGSAVFVYFINKIIGYTESHALMAQGILIAANVSVLFIYCNWRKVNYLLLNMVLSIVLLVIIKNNLYNLLVDTLLGLIALSISVIAFYYRKDWKRSLIVNTPLLLLLMLVKDSGKIFLLFQCMLILWFVYVYFLRGKPDKFKQRKILVYVLICTIVIPMATNYLWIKYTQKAYPEASYDSNKFALSVNKIAEVDKTMDFKENLAPSLIRASFNLESTLFQSILLMNVLLIVLTLTMILVKRQFPKTLVQVFTFGNFVFVLYILGIYMMYLFMMPEKEAAKLAGFNRYYSTIVIYVLGLFMTFIAYEFSKLSSKIVVNIVVAILIALVFIYPYQENFIAASKKPDVMSSLRYEVKENYAKLSKSGKVKQVIYYSPLSQTDSGYLQYLLKYEHLSNNYKVITSVSDDAKKDEFMKSLKNSSHLVVLDTDNSFNEYFKNLISSQDDVEGAYNLSEQNHQLVIKRIDHKTK
ncbi:hypothetical protein NDK25_13595 [Niallia taxi]|nr:hypothetical protein [Niallia taxi]MDE5053270.1 hypothetical protein [Niallia taxi]